MTASPDSTVHPTDATSTDPLMQPVTAATGARLLAQLGLTEGEAQAILGLAPATPDELAQAAKVDLHALCHALTPATVQALVTDPKVELGSLAQGFEARAANVRVLGAAEDKLHQAIDDIHGAVRLDATLAQQLINTVVPQLRTRARVNPAVRITYSPLLAYQHARFPGRRAVVHAPPGPGSAGEAAAPKPPAAG